jgi:ABC-type spermidine/putrescine transport system permease subunit I
MNNSRRDKRKQKTNLKVLIIIALGLTLMVTAIVYIIKDSNQDKKLENYRQFLTNSYL